MKIINIANGETVAEIVGGNNMTKDEAINIVGEIHPERDEECVLIGDEWYYYDDLEIEAD